MKHVLWISRHTMTADQEADLRRICGEIELEQLDRTLTSVDEIAGQIDRADVICAVLPVEMLSKLYAAAGSRPILIAESERKRISDSNGEAQYAFVHKCWHKVDACQYSDHIASAKELV